MSMGAQGVILPTGQMAIQLVASLVPVPGLEPAVNLFFSIVQLCQNVSVNKNLLAQLLDRCAGLLQALTIDDSQHDLPDKFRDAVVKTEFTLQSIRDKVIEWQNISRRTAFFKQTAIADDIKRLHADISNCYERLQTTAQISSHQWQQSFLETQEELLQCVDQISSSQADSNAMLKTIMQQLQSSLSTENRHEPKQQAIQNALRQLSKGPNGSFSNLLPELILNRGEVDRTGQCAVACTPTADIWEGKYLGKEKVAICVIRALNCDERTLQRFEREAVIWAEIYKADRDGHILPFLGVCTNDGPYPCLVSPWQPNGTAIDYVKLRGRSVDHKNLIRGIAQGLLFLHTMQGPIVHGDVKGENIFISDIGRPLLANFRLAKVVEDITGVPFTQSQGVGESYRWFAPEVCMDQGCLSIKSDIYAFAMTTLELLTHEPPYGSVKHPYDVIRRAANGEKPERPNDTRVIQRGLDDKLWRLLTSCWDRLPTKRPDMQDILSSL